MILNKYPNIKNCINNRIVIDAAFLIRAHFYLIIIVFFYLIITLYNVFNTGIVSSDEGYFITVVHTYSNLFKTLLFHPQKLFSFQYYADLSNSYGAVYTAARPIYILLATIIDMIWTSMYSTRLVSVIAGGLAILFFYKILNFYGIRKNIVLIFTILFAFSPLLLIYSHLGLSSMLSAFFLLIALFYTLKFNHSLQTKYLKLSAVFSSFLLMSHYNTIILVAILFLYVFMRLYKSKSRIKNYFFYTLFFVLPIFFWEIITRIGVILAQSKNFLVLDKDQKIFSYIQEIMEQIMNRAGAGTIQGFSFDQLFYYLQLLAAFEGLAIFSLSILGLIIAAKNIKHIKYGIIYYFFLLFIIASSFLAIKTTRQIIVLLPIFYLLASLAFWRIYIWFSKRMSGGIASLLFICFVVAAIIPNIGIYNSIFNSKTNMPQAANFIISLFDPQSIVIYSSSASIWINYLPFFNVEPLGDMAKDLMREKSDKVILVIADRYTVGKGEEHYFEDYPKEIIGKFPAIVSAGVPDNIRPFFKDELPLNTEIIIHKILVDTH